jgi:CRP/FNR family cyclic AMP-dependent transcriptional regulator
MTTETITHSLPPLHYRETRNHSMALGRAARAIVDHPFFAGMDELEIDCLIGAAEILRFEAGETLFHRGDPGDSVLLVLSGRAAAEFQRSSRELVVMNVVEPGELVGEMAVLEGTTRSASVTALEPCEVLAIPQVDFLALLVNHPGVAIRMLGTVSERLRSLTEKVSELA